MNRWWASCAFILSVAFFGCSGSGDKGTDGDGGAEAAVVDTDGGDPCANVHCSPINEVCNPVDLQCHCLTADGVQCSGATPLCGTDGTCHALPDEATTCAASSRWTAGHQIFQERTEEWGLLDIKAEGVLLNSGDLNGDGYPDLVVRRGGTHTDNFAEGGTRWNWVLINDGSGHFQDITQASGAIAMREVSGTSVTTSEGDAGADDADVNADAGVPDADVAADAAVVADAAIADTDAGMDAAVATPDADVLPDASPDVFVVPDAAVDGSPPAIVGRPAEVWAFGDVDNDGDLDIYTGIFTNNASVVAGQTSELLINDGTAHFSLTSASNALRRAGVIDTVASASFVDFDRDGKIDIWVTQNGHETNTSLVMQPSRLFRGDGAGAFTDVTIEAGLMTADWTYVNLNLAVAHTRSWSATACDLNNDGAPELLSASYGRAPNGLYQASDNDGDVGYTNRSMASGYAFDMRTGYSDNQFYLCYCQHHPTAAVCEGAGRPLISCGTTDNWDPGQDTQAFRQGGNSATTLCADMDNDGDMDLVTTEIRHQWAGEASDPAELLVNNGSSDPFFDRPGRDSMGIEVPHPGGDRVLWDEGIMSGATLDFDNDGWRDFYFGGSDYPGNYGLLYHALGGGLHFESVPVAQGIDHNRSHGVTVADFDRDGDLDVVVGHGLSRCDATAANNCYATSQVRFFENIIGSEGNWVQLSLEGATGTNRAAIGARVIVKTRDTAQTFEVGGGHGIRGTQNDLVVHAGLGDECFAEVTIRWPNRALTTQTFYVTTGKRYAVRQGETPVVITD